MQAIESLSLFDYWDEVIHDFMMDMLMGDEVAPQVVQLLGEYAVIDPRAQQKLKEEFRTTEDSTGTRERPLM